MARNAPGADRERRVTATVVAFYALIAYVTMFPTWPSRLRTRIPDGVGDNLLNLWILHWGGHHLFSGWSRLWDAPIYWPHPNALAYSDSMLPIALLHRALAVALRSDVLAFNVIYLSAAFASMLGAYLLARRITGSVEGAFIAGLVYALATPRLVHYQHFNLGFACLVPFVVLLTIRYFDGPTVGRGVALGLVIAMLSLSEGYYALMTLVALLLIIPGLLITWRRFPIRRTLTGLAVGAACAALLATPVALRYAQFQRQPGNARDAKPALAAHLGDFARVPPDNRVVARVLPFTNRPAPVERYLFPGLVACILGAIGGAMLVRRLRRRAGPNRLEHLTLALCCAASLVLVVLSFGSSGTLGGHTYALPYRLVDDLPGFQGIRATSRFVAFPLLTLALLAALGFNRIVSARLGRERILLGMVVVAFVLVETSIPIQMNAVPTAPEQAAVNTELARRAAGPVVELPMSSPADRGSVWAAVETPRMWLATIDGNSRVGGYSGGQPNGFHRFARAINRGFPSVQTMDRIGQLGVRYVILRVSDEHDPASPEANGFYTEREARRIRAALPPARTRPLGRYGNAYLIEVLPTA